MQHLSPSDAEQLWLRASPGVQEGLKQALLQLVEQEQSRGLRRHISDVFATVAAQSFMRQELEGM